MSRDRALLWLASLVTVLICVFAVWDEMTPGYRRYQREFRQRVEEQLGPERAAATPVGLQQIWLPAADRVDRCVSCHLGTTWESLQGVERPYTAHPPGPLEHHPIEKFGCTLCHGGQGYATELPDAHGWVAHWGEPLLDPKLADDYRVRDEWAVGGRFLGRCFGWLAWSPC